MNRRDLDAMDPQSYARTKALFDVVCDLDPQEQEKTLHQFELVDPDATRETRRLLAFHNPVLAMVEGATRGSLNAPISQPANLGVEPTTEQSYAATSTTQLPIHKSRFSLCERFRLGGLPCFVVGAFVLVAIFWLARLELRRQLWMTRAAEIRRIADTFEHSVRREVDDKLLHFTQLTQTDRVREAIDFLLTKKRPDSLEITPDAERQGYLARELLLRKQLTLRNYGPVQFVFRNRDGYVLAYSLNRQYEGELAGNLNRPNLHDLHHVRDGKPRLHLPHNNWKILKSTSGIDQRDDISHMLISDVWFIVPIVDHDNEVIGVISFRDGGAHQDLDRLCRHHMFGETGEIVPFDDLGYTITPTRLSLKATERLGGLSSGRSRSNEVGLAEKIELVLASFNNSESNAAPAMREHTGYVPSKFYEKPVVVAADYRNVPCLIHFRWLDEFGFGFLVKIDKAEALDLPATRGKVLFNTLLGLFCIALAIKLVTVVRKWRWKPMVGQMVGPYLIVEKIAEGGMGVVYKARHQMLGRAAAVKVLRKGMLDQDSRQRFDREVRLVSRLKCKHTICIYDYGTSSRGEPFFAMELLQGICLEQAIATAGPFSASKTLQHMAEIAMSLREAHHFGIIHRDLTPQNLMLTTDIDGQQSMVVIDFGLAKPIGHREQANDTLKRHWSGTPGYMSPERIRDPNDTDPRSDIFALGAVGFFMMTGRAPFDANSREETLGKVLDGKSCVTSYLPHVGGLLSSQTQGDAPTSESQIPAVMELILQCLARDAKQRPQTMDELLLRVQNLQTRRTAKLGHC